MDSYGTDRSEMTPQRFNEALHAMHWTTQTLADALGCDLSFTEALAEGRVEVPVKLGAWLETLAQCHEAAASGKPVSLRGKKFVTTTTH